jgi:hypothetical protein
VISLCNDNLKLEYPAGTRILLLNMDDSFAVPSGMRGTVHHVDDGGNIHMRWDNGRTLAIVPEVDTFRKLTEQEIQEEMQEPIQPEEISMNTM